MAGELDVGKIVAELRTEFEVAIADLKKELAVAAANPLAAELVLIHAVAGDLVKAVELVIRKIKAFFREHDFAQIAGDHSALVECSQGYTQMAAACRAYAARMDAAVQGLSARGSWQDTGVQAFGGYWSQRSKEIRALADNYDAESAWLAGIAQQVNDFNMAIEAAVNDILIWTDIALATAALPIADLITGLFGLGDGIVDLIEIERTVQAIEEFLFGVARWNAVNTVGTVAANVAQRAVLSPGHDFTEGWKYEWMQYYVLTPIGTIFPALVEAGPVSSVLTRTIPLWSNPFVRMPVIGATLNVIQTYANYRWIIKPRDRTRPWSELLGTGSVLNALFALAPAAAGARGGMWVPVAITVGNTATTLAPNPMGPAVRGARGIFVPSPLVGIPLTIALIPSPPSLAPAQVPVPPPLSPPHYIVQPGDTLWAITGAHYGDPSKYPAVAQLNHIPNPNLIHPHDDLVLPPLSPSPLPVPAPPPVLIAPHHVIVQPGQSLWTIARAHYGDPTKALMIARANHVLDPDRIRPGQNMFLP